MNSNTGNTSPRLGVIEIGGEDAASFLRAQLTNDVSRLGPDRHFLAAWCDAKGRAQMVARVAQVDAGYLLLLPETIIDTVLNRLRMYVLRAKVSIADVSANYRVEGVIGNGLPAPDCSCTNGDTLTLGLPTGVDGQARALMISSIEHASPGSTFDTSNDQWLMTDIDAGIPTLYPATQGLFVPQMLNLHWLMAIDFDKGCYPGQEVIARLHYRGTLTRRLFRLTWQGDRPTPGDAVKNEAGENSGTVVTTAAEDAGHGRLLAVLKTSAQTAQLASDGATLALLDLPYAVPA